MPRTITGTNKAQAKAPQVRVAILFEADFPSGFVRVNSTSRSIDFDSDGDGNDETFLGIGQLGDIKPIEEKGGLEISSLVVSISGLESSFLSTALQEAYQGRTAKLWVAFFDDQWKLADAPTLMFQGRMDTMEPVNIGETSTIELSIENRFADWARPRESRYTHEQQQIDFPGDKGFEFVNQMVEKKLTWGNG